MCQARIVGSRLCTDWYSTEVTRGRLERRVGRRDHTILWLVKRQDV